MRRLELSVVSLALSIGPLSEAVAVPTIRRALSLRVRVAARRGRRAAAPVRRRPAVRTQTAARLRVEELEASAAIRAEALGNPAGGIGGDATTGGMGGGTTWARAGDRR